MKEVEKGNDAGGGGGGGKDGTRKSEKDQVSLKC